MSVRERVRAREMRRGGAHAFAVGRKKKWRMRYSRFPEAGSDLFQVSWIFPLELSNTGSWLRYKTKKL